MMSMLLGVSVCAGIFLMFCILGVLQDISDVQDARLREMRKANADTKELIERIEKRISAAFPEMMSDPEYFGDSFSAGRILEGL